MAFYCMTSWLWIGAAVVEHATHNPMIEGSNPATGTSREKMTEKLHGVCGLYYKTIQIISDNHK